MACAPEGFGFVDSLVKRWSGGPWIQKREGAITGEKAIFPTASVKHLRS